MAIDLKKALLKANSHAISGDYEKAIGIAESVLSKEPGNVSALNISGACYIRQGPLESAERYFKMAILHDPKNYFAHGELGKVFIMQGRYSESISEFKKAIKFNKNNKPRSYEYFVGIGYSYTLLKRHADSQNAIKLALAHNPSAAFELLESLLDDHYKKKLSESKYQSHKKLFKEARQKFSRKR